MSNPEAQSCISRRNTSACRPVECENSVPALEPWSRVEHITRLHISARNSGFSLGGAQPLRQGLERSGGGVVLPGPPLDEPAMHRMHLGFQPVVGSELLVDCVQVVPKRR